MIASEQTKLWEWLIGTRGRKEGKEKKKQKERDAARAAMNFLNALERKKGEGGLVLFSRENRKRAREAAKACACNIYFFDFRGAVVLSAPTHRVPIFLFVFFLSCASSPLTLALAFHVLRCIKKNSRVGSCDDDDDDEERGEKQRRGEWRDDEETGKIAEK